MTEGVARLFGEGSSDGRGVPAPDDGLGEGCAVAPARDHYVYVDGKSEAILLASLYPDELSRERAARAFRRANPGRKVEVRCRMQEDRKE